ncbi:MAG: FtsX-like permease family protein [Thermodesulfobacteriota bacterium]
MNLLTIPLRYARRKWPRTLLLTLVFALGATSMAALWHVSRVVGESLERKLTAFGANILVSPKAETLAVSYGGVSLGNLLYEVRHLDETEAISAIRSIKNAANLAAVAPKLVGTATVGAEQAPVVGVRFDQEQTIKKYWRIKGMLPTAENEVVLGSAVAARLGLDFGSSLHLGDREVTVAGVLSPTGGDDDAVVLADLGLAQRLFGLPGKVSFVEVSALCAGCPIEEIVAQIGGKLPGLEVKALRSVVEGRMASVHFVQHLTLAVALVILVSACAVVGFSMLSAVNERKAEIGLLRSLGYSRPGIFAIFCFEALLLGAAAGAAGSLAGYVVGRKVVLLLDAAEVLPVFSPLEALAVCLGMALVAALAAAYPAAKAARIEPSAALVAL